MLSYVPVVGTQVDAVRDLTAAADRAGDLGEATATDVQTALDHASEAGPSGRVPLIDAVSAASDRLQDGLQHIDVGAKGWLFPPLAGARSDLARALSKADVRLDDGRTTLRTLRAFFAGPRRYLVLGGNNAEMRTTGIATTSGVATIDDGAVEVGDFLDAGKTAINKPGVALPEGWGWLFGYLDPDIAYSNLVASPNFPLTGETAAAISARNVFGPVDGVIYVDTIALQRLLDVVGAVTVDGVTYDGTNAARILINENYLHFSSDERDVRREAQGRVATAIFDAMNTRHVPLVKLAAALQDLAAQRHLFAWSSNADEEKLWSDVGASGERSPDDLLVAAEELGTSKLDYYVTEQVQMSAGAAPNGRRVQLSVTLTNPQRTVSSPYIDGGSIFAQPGEYGVYLVVYLPHDAFDLDNSDPNWTSWATDGPLQATTFTARVPEGTSKTISVAFSLPASTTRLTVLPSARVAPATWRAGNLGTFRDLTPTTLDLDAVPTGEVPGNAAWMVVGLLLFGVGAVLYGEQRERTGREVAWWLLVVGVAMCAVQLAMFITA